MTKNYQLLKGAQMGGRFKSPGKSPKRLTAGRRRSGGGGAGGGGPLAAVGGGGAGVAANIRVAVRVRSDKNQFQDTVMLFVQIWRLFEGSGINALEKRDFIL